MVNVVRRFPVTMGLLGLTVGMFLLEHWLGGGMDPVAHLRLGALWPDRIIENGEYFRLFTVIFIHGGLVHLLLNGFALLQLGALVEAFWGSRRLVVYFVVCGLGASLASALGNLGTPYSVGGSGAILGLAGLVLGTSWYGESPVREQLLALVGRQLLYAVLLTFGLGFGLWLIVPIVDNWGHIGGFVTGLLIAGAVPDPSKEDLRRSLASAAAAIATLVAAFGWMALEGGRAVEPEGMVQFARVTAAQVSQGRSADPPGTLAIMTATFAEAGAADEGVETLRRAVQRMRDPVSVQRVFYRMVMLEEAASAPTKPTYQQGSLIAAERWVELSPDDATALNALAWQLVQGSPTNRAPLRAIDLAQQGLERTDTDDTFHRSMVLDTLAEAQYQARLLDAAERNQAEAVRLAEAEEPTFWQRLQIVPSLPLEQMQERLERIRADTDAR